MSNNFSHESTNPRQRRAYAHSVISKYKEGRATYAEAFEAAYKGSQTGDKGRNSNFGRAIGGVLVDAYAQRYDNDTVVVSGLSPAKQEEVSTKHATGELHAYSPDAYMVRPGAQNTPNLKGIIHDPIAEGFIPLPPKQ
ncbi:MAG: hypothetical protein M1554_01035 [Patescibacteria group bacterium]|nr:hypothetical protein [Patescibacteria group bacterium]